MRYRAAWSPDEVRWKEQAHNLGATIFQSLRNSSDARHKRSNKIQLVTSPDDLLTGLESPVVLDLFQPLELSRFTRRADRCTSDRAVGTALVIFGVVASLQNPFA